ncbi:hypothetical protein BDZ89DRAFT_1168222 [Hymenopellis radicata]|nr:hypothetical protein BDZ89DRAFT_1168222 [Hymenopellis radicata]
MDYPMFSPEASTSSASSSASPSSSIHHASFVDPSTHSPVLMQMLDLPISESVIDYLVERVADTVEFAINSSHPSYSRGRNPMRRQKHPKFTEFATNVLRRSETTTAVLLTTLVYIDRSKRHLQIAHNEWAMERVFLGALILASKYLNDSTLKNVHWATCTGVFGKRDIGRVEREFLDVLDFELHVSEADLLMHHHLLTHGRSHSRSPSPPSRNVRPRHHTRNAPAASSVPALEPSSPSSSDDAPSPKTPSTPELEYIPQTGKAPKSRRPFHVKSIPVPLPHRRRVLV